MAKGKKGAKSTVTNCKRQQLMIGNDLPSEVNETPAEDETKTKSTAASTSPEAAGDKGKAVVENARGIFPYSKWDISETVADAAPVFQSGPSTVPAERFYVAPGYRKKTTSSESSASDKSPNDKKDKVVMKWKKTKSTAVSKVVSSRTSDAGGDTKEEAGDNAKNKSTTKSPKPKSSPCEAGQQKTAAEVKKEEKVAQAETANLKCKPKVAKEKKSPKKTSEKKQSKSVQCLEVAFEVSLQTEAPAEAVQTQENEADLLSMLQPGGEPPDNWENKLANDAIEDPAEQMEREYARQFLEDSVKIKTPKTPGQKIVIDSRVMKDYGHVYSMQHQQPIVPLVANINASPTSVISLIDGDLFDSPFPLAHCVSEDLRMSSGIAVSFRRRFGHVAELLNQRKRVGQIAVLRSGPRFIYYLVTKEFYLAKPESVLILYHCLALMKEHCMQHGISQVAMPKIGCGRDHLNWTDVAAVIEETFAGSGIRVNVYQMQEPMTPWSQKRPHPATFFPSPPPCKRLKLDRPAAPQELLPHRPLVVVHQFNQSILEIRPPVMRIFLASSQPGPPLGAALAVEKSLRVWQELMSKHERVVGTAVPVMGGHVMALICRAHVLDPVDFVALHRAAKNLLQFMTAYGSWRLALEGFVEDFDRVIVSKVVTVMRMAFVNSGVHLSVAWPKDPPYVNLIKLNQQQKVDSSPSSSLLAPNEYDY